MSCHLQDVRVGGLKSDVGDFDVPKDAEYPWYRSRKRLRNQRSGKMEQNTNIHLKKLTGYVDESVNREEDFHFLRFESLQRLNIANLQVDLASMKSQLFGQQHSSATDLERLREKLEQYGMLFEALIRRVWMPGFTSDVICAPHYVTVFITNSSTLGS